MISRAAGALVALAVLAALAWGCSRQPEVVLYTSCDDYLLREVIPAFEAKAGVRVRVVGDTESTKTTGLVQRVLAERDRPRADVWWSNEPFGTIRLDGEGLLARPARPIAGGADRAAWLIGPEGRWHGFALRSRAIVYNTKRVQDPPRDEATLSDPAWRGRIGMARPQFGTTRGLLGHLWHTMGREGFEGWARGMKANGVRVFDGNSAVVRAVAEGVVDVGLTDSDDVHAGIREGWPVAMVVGEASLLIPNTAGLVRGGPNSASGATLLEFLLGEEVERMLARSDSRTMPARLGLAEEFADNALPARPADLAAVAGSADAALASWEAIMGR
ncbi:MAG: ABC transporter substrate-binding protein [Phycisphaerae bacterium]|nr:ABC transporter substrate-binding protein [Phycisphaerae bacterium]